MSSSTILPGATIGIIGGGQLGRMTGFAARSMGYDVHILDPEPDCAAAAIASRVVNASYDDVKGAHDFASHCDVITIEIERIARDVLEAAASHAPLRPGVEAINIVQERARQKEWLRSAGFPVGEFAVADTADELKDAVSRLAPCVAKTTMGGYDGRGQVRFPAGATGEGAWDSLGSRCIVERFLDIELEVSVMTARGANGEVAIFPPSRNHHDHGILTWSVTPAGISPELEREAMQLGSAVAERLGIVGLLAVEMFVTRDGRLLVNELAPRPHNTFHQSERALVTGQFEQLVRAVCGLSLGSVAPVTPAAIQNLLGDVWSSGEPAWPRALVDRNVRLHLYGKAGARPGRKMGHFSAVGDTPDDAVLRVRRAFDAIAPTAG